ncbi:MAG TPA: AI-2E family transporter [Vicinamibacteria bacterium]|nr:AI-2E family transporter [Vicinamibacteria bacterium]
MANGGRREYDWRPWAPSAGDEGTEDPAELVPRAPETPQRRGLRTIRSASLNGLFVLACIYTLAIARALFVPLAVGLILYFLLLPPVRLLKKARVPEPLGAALVLLALFGTVGIGIYGLSWPAANWAARAPESVQRVQVRLRPLARRLQRLTRTAEEMGNITDATAPASATPEVKIKEPTVGALFVGGVQSFLAGTVVVFTLVYFLLADGEELLRKIVRAFPRLKDRKRAVEIAREMERQISGYLFFTTLMNAAFGAMVAVVMWLLGMPNPMLWGFVAGVTKFIPYLGGLMCTIVLGLASMVAFEDMGRALLVPAVFLAIDTIHGNVLLPLLLGRRFTLDPTALFVGLFFWWFVWGTAGALLAVPMMAALRIFCDHVDGLQRLGRFLAGSTDADILPEADGETPATTAPA